MNTILLGYTYMERIGMSGKCPVAFHKDAIYAPASLVESSCGSTSLSTVGTVSLFNLSHGAGVQWSYMVSVTTSLLHELEPITRCERYPASLPWEYFLKPVNQCATGL